MNDRTLTTEDRAKAVAAAVSTYKPPKFIDLGAMVLKVENDGFAVRLTMFSIASPATMAVLHTDKLNELREALS